MSYSMIASVIAEIQITRNLSAYQSFSKKKSFFRNEFFMMKTNTEHLVYMISESLFLEMKTT